MMLFVKGRGPQLKTPILLTWKEITKLPVNFPLVMFPLGLFHFLWLPGMFDIESTYIAVFFLYKFEERRHVWPSKVVDSFQSGEHARLG